MTQSFPTRRFTDLRRADKCRTIRQRADLTVRLVSGSGHRLDWTDSFYNQQKFFSHGSRRREKVKRAYVCRRVPRQVPRSEEHTSELQSLMRISYAVFCLKKKSI